MGIEIEYLSTQREVETKVGQKVACGREGALEGSFAVGLRGASSITTLIHMQQR